ncbi:DEAD/DEAH box helicase, partial [Candidatus Woesearchaeota archaeon]|nr:DEAD/DEAH box helicase [Candidatus Woesearchaeota archaeon]
MQLKKYQLRSLREFEAFLLRLREKEQAILPTYPALKSVGSVLPDPAEAAWKDLFQHRRYVSRVNAVGEPVPNVCLKIPTGGGKTLLACHAIASLSRVYRHSNYGMVLWIVPTDQIYTQTLRALKDRDHSYRRALDAASGGRTKVIGKEDRFEPEDVRDSMVVMVMMLQSANRKNQDYLKAFKSSGKFIGFFPESDRYDFNSGIIEDNGLDVVEDLFQRLSPKTSLGNVMKLVRPMVIVDEGHKASSFLARDTIFSLNPSIVVELTATPYEGVQNTLVQIGGMDLLEEGMIKLDMHVTTKASDDWKDTLRESLAKLNVLQDESYRYRSNSNIYIRPICLIQVERTGKDQRDGELVHSEDVREFLVNECSIPTESVAVKTSQINELKQYDNLLSELCPVRFIITQRALQEGWDCSFAYILSILTNPKS